MFRLCLVIQFLFLAARLWSLPSRSIAMQTVNHYGKALVKSLIATKSEADLVPGDNQENFVCHYWQLCYKHECIFICESRWIIPTIIIISAPRRQSETNKEHSFLIIIICQTQQKDIVSTPKIIHSHPIAPFLDHPFIREIWWCTSYRCKCHFR